jgi:hypothetical protein
MKIAGVYAVNGPAGIYVGEADDCFRRNNFVMKLGLDWGIVLEMPGSTKQERMVAEGETADAWAARGFAVVSRNLPTGRSSRQREALSKPETRARMRAAAIACRERRVASIKKAMARPEYLEKRRALGPSPLKGGTLSPKHREALRAAHARRRVQDPVAYSKAQGAAARARKTRVRA